MLQLTRPLVAQLEVTDRCNFRCRHCYHFDFDCKKDSKDLSDEQVMLMAAKLAENHIFSLIITGGEPLVRKDLTSKLVEYFKGENVDVSLNTNLQLLDHKTLDGFMEAHLDGMLISCPSTDPKVYYSMTGGGDFLRFSRKLNMVLDKKQHCSLNMVVNRRNFGCIRETAKYLRDLGVEIFGATPMGMNLQRPDMENLLTLSEVRALIEELVWIKENLGLSVDIFEAIPKCVFPLWVRDRNLAFLNRKCQAGKTVISVSNNGDVRPCSHNPDSYGNIMDESLSDIWQKMGGWRNLDNIPERCATCEVFSKCHGGCRITAKACTGDCHGEDPWMDFLNASGEWPAKSRSTVSPSPEMTVVFAKIFRWRQENENGYIISSTRNNRNLTVVNKQLFNFVKLLREVVPLSLEDLAKRAQCDPADLEFGRVIELLATREFISLQPSRKEVIA